MIPYLQFSALAEFSDRLGETQEIAGCSPLGVMEFWDRIRQIQRSLQDSGKHWISLFHQDEHFRFMVLRCLELNAVDPDWLNFEILEQFLFHRWDAEKEEFAPGWLLELNSPPESNTKTTTVDALTSEELVAAIALTCGNLQEGMQIAQELRPAHVLAALLEAQAELKDEKLRDKKKLKKVTQRMKDRLGMEELKRLINTPVEELEQAQAQAQAQAKQAP
jgi:hypothetical protein